ncbi:MAG: membrane-associated phospholipid phosphatase [Massilia sp.]
MMALIVEIGHTAVMLPMAGAIAAWLLAGRAWQRALCWCLMFAAGLSMVALSKIAFLGWETGIPSLHFDALSGHAFRAAAVIPVFFFVVLQGTPTSWRAGGVACGIALGVGIAVLLVRFGFHTASEVIASSVLGCVVGLGFMRIAAGLPAPRISRSTVLFSVIIFAAIFALKPSSISHRLVDIALYLSQRDHPFVWSKIRDR